MTRDADPPRRTLQELLTFHELEPGEASVITEGPSDRALGRWFLDEAGLTTPVYEVGSFEVPADLTARHGQENSNRGRVITIALEAAHLRPSQVACIIDADLDRLLRRGVASTLILITDYSCMEMYACNPKTINKFIRIHKNTLSTNGRVILQELVPVLHSLFLARAANALLAWNMQSVDWTKSARIRRGNGNVTFDEADFHRRYLQKNGRWKDAGAFNAQVGELSTRIAGDPRHFINGHDFVEALEWYLAHLNGGFQLKGAVLRNVLLGSIERADLASEPMFEELVRRLKR